MHFWLLPGVALQRRSEPAATAPAAAAQAQAQAQAPAQAAQRTKPKRGLNEA